MQNDMRIAILLATLLVITVDLFSQGGVDVKYIPIDSIGTSILGQRIKIDFKSTTKGTKEYLIQKARIRDTVKITIDGKLIEIIEHKGTGADHWYFEKEYLESFDYNPSKILRINEIEVLEIRTNSILFRMTMDQFEKMNEKLRLASSEKKDIWVLKDKIEGILIKE